MIYEEKIKIGLNDIGKNNKLKNYAILEMLENIGGYHSSTVGYGVNDMQERGIGWILLDWKVKVLNRPKYEDREGLLVKTWCKKADKFFVYRDYEIYDTDGNLCVIATSKWAIMDLKTRKMARITDEMKQEFNIEEKDVFFGTKLDKISVPKEFLSEYDYMVRRCDLDVNGHMHNLQYLNLAYEAMPEDVYEQRPFDHVRISYKKEILFGENLKCKYTKQDEKNIIVIESDGDIRSIIEIF